MFPSASSLSAQLQERRRRLVAAPSVHRVPELIREVDATLARIDEGTFGVCERCHDPIEEERLAADPTLRVCLGCLTPIEQRALEHDLELAAGIQRALLPSRSAFFDGWETYYHYEPLGIVSGDHLDLIETRGSRGDVYFAFGDVSGKGVSASILMAQLHAVLRSLVAQGLPLEELLARSNQLFYASTPANFYATLVLGRLSRNGTVELANAGHCPPLLSRGGALEPIEATALPIGAFSPVSFRTRTFELAAGDAVLLYTDGLTDAADGMSYDPFRAWSTAAGATNRSARRMTEALLADHASFRNGNPRSDDLTLMTIRRR